MDEGNPIPGGAYADDMVLHTNTKKQLQSLLDKSVQYFNQIELEISVDRRDKSVYTSTTGSPITRQEQLTVTIIKNGKEEIKALPYYESHELLH